MRPIEVAYGSASPHLVSTADELNNLLDLVRSDNWDRGPVMVVLTPAGEEGRPSRTLEVGIDRDQGVLRYSTPDAACWSLGDQTQVDEVEYYLRDQYRACPVSALVPYVTVKTAAAEFLLEAGARPMTPIWQAEELET